MKLNNNFRKNELRRVKTVTSVLYALTVTMIGIGFLLYANYQIVSKKILSVDAQLNEIVDEIKVQSGVYMELGEVSFDAGNLKQVNQVLMFENYMGFSPEVILYDIEKYSPPGFYVSSFDYDRITGMARISAIIPADNALSTMLESFKSSGGYKKVMLVSKSEISGTSNLRVTIHVEGKDAE